MLSFKIFNFCLISFYFSCPFLYTFYSSSPVLVSVLVGPSLLKTPVAQWENRGGVGIFSTLLVWVFYTFLG